MKFTQLLVLSSFFLVPSLSVAQVKAPAGFDLKSRSKIVEAQAQKDGVTSKMNLEKIDIRKVEIGTGKLNLITARFGPGNSESAGGYNLSELSMETGKVLFQLVDKTGCESKIIEELTIRKLGFVGDVQIYFAPVQLVPPTCPNAVANPKIFLVIQESKKNFEKVYQSDISENGRYRIAFKKEVIRLDYTKNLNSDSIAVELVWDEKLQKFAPENP